MGQISYMTTEESYYKHRCWNEIFCACDGCGVSGCRDCLDLLTIEKDYNSPEYCMTCYRVEFDALQKIKEDSEK